jgi:hypothetical protein
MAILTALHGCEKANATVLHNVPGQAELADQHAAFVSRILEQCSMQKL